MILRYFRRKAPLTIGIPVRIVYGAGRPFSGSGWQGLVHILELLKVVRTGKRLDYCKFGTFQSCLSWGKEITREEALALYPDLDTCVVLSQLG